MQFVDMHIHNIFIMVVILISHEDVDRSDGVATSSSIYS